MWTGDHSPPQRAPRWLKPAATQTFCIFFITAVGILFTRGTIT